MAVRTDASATTSSYTQQATLLHRVATMRQGVDYPMIPLQQWYKEFMIGDSQCTTVVFGRTLLYIYLYQPPMATFSVDRLATESYNNLMLHKTGPPMVLKISRTTITITEDGTRRTSPPVRLQWCHRRGSQSDKLYTLQGSLFTDETISWKKWRTNYWKRIC